MNKIRRHKPDVCIIKTNKSSKQVMPHVEFMQRVRKSLYFGCDLNGEGSDALQISKPLAEYASELFSESHKGYTLNRLRCTDACNMQTATPATLIMALIYLDRLTVTDPAYVRRITPHELFIVSMMISAKFYAGYDEEVYLSDWAEDGNISENQLLELEMEFLNAIDWSIYISNEEFFDKLRHIEKCLALQEGLRRGWLTYSELMQLLPSFALAKFVINNLALLVASYAASILTIAGAILFATRISANSIKDKSTEVFSFNLQHSVNQTNTAIHLDWNLNRQPRNLSQNDVDIRNTQNARHMNEILKSIEEQYKNESLQERLNQSTSETIYNYDQNSSRQLHWNPPRNRQQNNIKSQQYCLNYNINYIDRWKRNPAKYSFQISKILYQEKSGKAAYRYSIQKSDTCSMYINSAKLLKTYNCLSPSMRDYLLTYSKPTATYFHLSALLLKFM